VPASGRARCLHIAAIPCGLCLERFLKNRSRAAGRPALFPQLSQFQIPDATSFGKGIRADAQHTHLPAMVGFVRNHVAQHFQANGQGEASHLCELLDAASTAERFRRASPRSERRSRPIPHGLLRRAMRAVELSGTFRCGAVSLTHLERTLCICVKIAQWCGPCRVVSPSRVGSRCSIRVWFMRSLRRRSGLRLGRVECEPCVDAWSRLPTP